MTVSPFLKLPLRSQEQVRSRPQFGSIARVKFDERELLKAIHEAEHRLEMALENAIEFSDAMKGDYRSYLDSFKNLVHDEGVSMERLERDLGDAQ